MSDKKPILVMIVDDHQMVRRGLGLLIKSYDDLTLIGEAANGEEAIQLCEKMQPDVILMDIIMPIMDGIEATRIIRDKYPHIRIIALTSSSETDSVMAAVKAGATSYLLKNVSDDVLADAIRATRDGKHVLSPEATQALINAAIQPASPHYDLSERETEVLSLMVEGLNNLEIAERLFLSRSTIKYHINGIFIKLGVTNRFRSNHLSGQKQFS